MRIWSESEEQFIIQNYGEMTAKEIADHFGLSKASVKNRINKLGIRLPEEIRKRNCEKGQFKPGQIPLNKGKKMSDEIKAKYSHTFYKKGNRPHNSLPVDSIIVNSDGYLVKKVAEPNKWLFVHRMIWEQLNGEIPEGCNIQFKDNNRKNIDPNNLVLVRKSDNMRMNSIHNYPPEIKQLIRLSAKLNRKLQEYGTK